MFDWKLAIEKNKATLAQVVAGLFVLVRCAPGTIPGSNDKLHLSKNMRNHLATVLRKAEAALRRLLVLFVRVHSVAAKSNNTPQAPLPDFSAFTSAHKNYIPRFNLIDPRKPLRLPLIDETPIGLFETSGRSHQANETTPNTAHFLRRLAALDHALKPLPAQAKRLARTIERRKTAPPGTGCVGPIRPGRPPGHCQRPKDEADHVLRECHGLMVDHIANPP